MTILKYIYFFLFGALWGSFFYTLGVRYVNGSIKNNPFKALFTLSKCRHCSKKIKRIMLFPILSYIILKGKCGYCKGKISIEYPVFEIIFGLLLLYIISFHGITFYSFNILLILGVAITISYIDIKMFIIPDSLVIIFCFLSLYPVILNYSFKDNIYGLLLMFIFFAVILLLFPGSFGGGDVKFASVIGFLLGIEFSIVALEAALISGALTGIYFVFKSRKTLKSKLAFGPFLTLGLIVSHFYGRDLILYYYKFLFR